MLKFNPAERITVEEALQHEYLARLYKNTPQVASPSEPIKMEFEYSKVDRNGLKKLVYAEVIAQKQKLSALRESASKKGAEGEGKAASSQNSTKVSKK